MNACRILVEKHLGNTHFEDRGRTGRIILRWILGVGYEVKNEWN
jgi:hypothetical protein